MSYRGGIDASIYDEVFSAELDPTTLEDLFVRFNSGGHPLHRGWSMSVSDAVVIEPEGIPMLVGEMEGRELLYYYESCASIVNIYKNACSSPLTGQPEQMRKKLHAVIAFSYCGADYSAWGFTMSF